MDPTNLRNTRPRDLDRYIERFLLPDTTFRTEVRRAIDTIASFLKERCFQDTGKLVRVTKVVKGGSSGKGTALRGRSDADLVVFLSNLRSYQDQIIRRGEFIKEIKRRLEEWEHEQGWRFKVKFEVSKWPNPRVLSFTMKSENISQEVEFDVLPAFDVLGQVTPDFKPNPQVYVNLISESCNGGEFSTCFTELQKRFLKQRCTKLKSLILLVKCWYRMCKEKMTKLPPQYALELLTVYAWEHGSRQTYFNTAQGFRTVLYLIEGYQKLLVFWTINYDFQNENIRRYLWSKLKKPRPVILDPADPTCDLSTGCWDKLAEEAQSWSSAPCFKNQDGSWVEPWDVPLEQTEIGRRGFHLSTSLEEAYFFDEPTEREADYYYLESGGRRGQWGRLAQECHHLSSSAPYFQKQGGCWVEPRDVWVKQTHNGSTGFHLPSDSETEDSLKWASVSCDHHSPPAAQNESYCTIL